ncbi:MAG: hypothetical protein ACK56F_25530, partial [bacterium]
TTRAKRCANQEHTKGLPSDWHWGAGDWDNDLGGGGHDRRADDGQREALQSSAKALAQEDGEEEVAQRHAVLGGGNAAHGGHCASNLHLVPPYGRCPFWRGADPQST